MKLEKIYKEIANCIVSINLRSSPEQNTINNASYNPIIGTGFVVGEEGIILTCGHIVDAIVERADFDSLNEFNKNTSEIVEKLKKGQRVNSKFVEARGDCPAYINFFIDDGKGVYICPCNIIRANKIVGIKNSCNRINSKIPDLGLLEVDVRDLKKVQICNDYKIIDAGTDVGTSGFPMGKDLLIGKEVIDNNRREYLQQASPTLKKGIISAILPMKCERPELFMTDIMVQGGQSGSPLFLVDTGEVIGVVIESIHQNFNYKYKINSTELVIQIPIPTGLSYSVPLHFLEKDINIFKEKILTGKKDLKNLIEKNLENGETVFVK
ncbi:MAG: serine protease [Clostridiaceae bacterium]|nr:serine protease [Clostridiaceae bacterium]